MKKTSLFMATAATVGALAAAVPLLAHAQDDQQQPQDGQQNPPAMMQQAPGQGGPIPGQGGMMRPGNLENNRDFRNAMMRRSQREGDQNESEQPEGQPGFNGGDASSTRPRPMMRFEDRRQNGEAQGIENGDENGSSSPEQDREGRFGMMPAWLAGSSTAPFGRHMDPEEMRKIMRRAAMFATTSDEAENGDIEKSRGQRHAELGVFAAMQSHLLSNLEDALGRLKDARSKIADRISKAEQNGRDMTEAKALLATADQKISTADAAIKSLSELAPAISGSGTNVNASTTVSLTQPRQVGAAAIQALTDARKALNDVVVAIAHAMGYQIGEDGRIVPPPAATSTPQTEGTTTASTTQQ